MPLYYFICMRLILILQLIGIDHPGSRYSPGNLVRLLERQSGISPKFPLDSLSWHTSEIHAIMTTRTTFSNRVLAQ